MTSFIDYHGDDWEMAIGDLNKSELIKAFSDLHAKYKQQEKDAKRYQYLRSKDLETISKGGVFAGRTPANIVLNGEDLDRAIDNDIHPPFGDIDMLADRREVQS